MNAPHTAPLARVIPVKPRQKAPSTDAARNARPVIFITTEEGEVNDRASKALANAPNVFTRGTSLVEIIEQTADASSGAHSHAAPIIRAIPKPVLRDRLVRSAYFCTQKPRGDKLEVVPARPPTWTVEAVHAMGSWPSIKQLVGFVETPVLRPDCTVLSERGYDERSGLYLTNAMDVCVADAPSQAECAEACALLADVFVDFPFADEASLSTAIAAYITPFARHAIDGPVPLNHIDANTRASGKSLLADAISIGATGRPIARTTYASDESEMSKRITAIALEGTGLVLLDNIASGSLLGNAPLDLVLTSTSINERVLGESRNTGPLPMRAIWFSTGNNILLAADTARRTLRIRLESRSEHPEDREGFKHGDLKAYVRKMRPLLASAALTVLRGYHAAGRPNPPSAYGSFEEWSSLVRGAVMWCGYADPKLTQQALRTESDTEASSLRALMAAVETLGRAVTARDLVEHASVNEAVREALETFAPPRAPNDLPTAKTLSRVLGKFIGRVIDGRALAHAGKTQTGVQMWAVKRVEP